MAQNRSRRLHLTRRILVSILLLAVAVTGILVYVYYSVGVTSVTNVTIEQVLADRNLLNGTYPNRNATFLFEVRIWSMTQYLNVNVEKPFFRVELSGVQLGNQTMDSGTIYPGSSLIYNLRFTVNESRIGYVPFTGNTHPVFIGVAARLTSGFYSQPATLCDSTTWNWTTATVWANGGSGKTCTV